MGGGWNGKGGKTSNLQPVMPGLVMGSGGKSAGMAQVRRSELGTGTTLMVKGGTVGPKGMLQPRQSAAAAMSPAAKVLMPQRQQPMENLAEPPGDADLAQAIDELTWALSDMNTPSDHIRQQVEHILAMRECMSGVSGMISSEPAQQILQPAPPIMAPRGELLKPSLTKGSKGQGKKRQLSPSASTEGGVNRNWTDTRSVNWKGLLLEASQKEVNRPPQAGDLEFQVESLDGEKTGPRFVSTIVCNVLSVTRGHPPPCYTGEERANTKKEAEQVAAQLAMSQEFPEAYNAALQAHEAWAQEHPEEISVEFTMDGQPVKKKLKSEGGALSGDPKSQLNHGCQLLVGRTLQKGDILYEATQIEGALPESGQSWIASVKVTFDTEERRFEGWPSVDKRQAEISAAAVAVEQLKDAIAEASAQRDVILAIKQAEKNARKGIGKGGKKGEGHLM